MTKQGLDDSDMRSALLLFHSYICAEASCDYLIVWRIGYMMAVNMFARDLGGTGITLGRSGRLKTKLLVALPGPCFQMPSNLVITRLTTFLNNHLHIEGYIPEFFESLECGWRKECLQR